MFSEKLKLLRKSAGLSQEALAERLNVSRQAVTKWETDAGLPETENLIAIAALFGTTIDDLLSGNTAASGSGSVFESVTEYDVDRKKKFDITIGGARSVTVTGYNGEKLLVRLSSDIIKSVQSDLKIKLDDVKSKLDIVLNRLNGLTESATKVGLDVSVKLPLSLLHHCELTAQTRALSIYGIESLEFDGKAESILLENTLKAELNCGCDTDIVLRNFRSVDVNQISCTSRLGIARGNVFRTVKKGIGNKIYFENDCHPAADSETENVIELNGIKSELIIYEIQP